jgi:hypothetical protein
LNKNHQEVGHYLTAKMQQFPKPYYDEKALVTTAAALSDTDATVTFLAQEAHEKSNEHQDSSASIDLNEESAETHTADTKANDAMRTYEKPEVIICQKSDDNGGSKIHEVISTDSDQVNHAIEHSAIILENKYISESNIDDEKDKDVTKITMDRSEADALSIQQDVILKEERCENVKHDDSTKSSVRETSLMKDEQLSFSKNNVILIGLIWIVSVIIAFVLGAMYGPYYLSSNS